MLISPINLFNINFKSYKQYAQNKLYLSTRVYEQTHAQNLSRILNEYKSKGIYTIGQLEEDLGYPKYEWFEESCFNLTPIKTELSYCPLLAGIDINDEHNRENLERITSKTQDIKSRTELIKEHVGTIKELRKWVQYGLLTPVKLKSKTDESDVNIFLYDISLDENQRCMDKLVRKRATIAPKLMRTSESSYYADADELTRCGIGSKKTLADLIDKKIIKGKHTKFDEDPKNDYVRVDVCDAKTQKILQILRDNSSVDIQKAKALFDVSEIDILKAIWSGEIDTLPAVFMGDMSSTQFNLSTKKNFRNFSKLVLCALARNYALKGKNYVHSGLALEIASKFYPELYEIASELYEGNDDLISAIRKKAEKDIYDTRRNYLEEAQEDENDDEDEANEILPNALTKEDIALIEKFENDVLHEADLDKFVKILKQSLKYESMFKNSGFRAIDDENVRKIILNHRHNHSSEE